MSRWACVRIQVAISVISGSGAGWRGRVALAASSERRITDLAAELGGSDARERRDESLAEICEDNERCQKSMCRSGQGLIWTGS